MVSLAETSALTTLTQEIVGAAQSGLADQLIAIRQRLAAPGLTTFSFMVYRSDSFVSLAPMIAPGPDCFVCVHGLDLHSGESWVEEVVLDLVTYDAGSRENNSFALFGPETQPRAVFVEKQGVPLGGLVVGRLTLKRSS